MLQAKQKAVQDTANRLLKANNTVTCLEIKVDLWNNSKESIGGVPYTDLYWDEQMISDCMNQNCQSWGLCFVDDLNPVPHRVYSLVGQPVNHPIAASPVAPTAQTNPRTGQPYKRGPYNTSKVVGFSANKANNSTPAYTPHTKRGPGRPTLDH